jgi:hypothetical protein
MNIKSGIRKTLIGTVVAATAFTGATVVTAAAAPPAHASKSDCLFVLAYNGYPLTNPRARACEIGASEQIGGWLICANRLVDSGVVEAVAWPACDAASE